MTIEELKKIITSNPRWAKSFAQSKQFKIIDAKETLINLTSFLADDALLQQRWWHLKNEIYNIPLCKICNKPNNWNRLKQLYNETCSSSCNFKLPSTRKKLEEAIYKKYGSTHALDNDTVKKKAKQTMLDRYGVENISQSNSFKEKLKQKNMEKYGVEYIFQKGEYRDKIDRIFKEKYGVSKPSQVKKFREKSYCTNMKKYGVKHPIQLEKFKEKGKNTSLIKYGKEYHNQKHISDEQFKLLNSKTWLIEQNHIKKLTLTEISNLLNVNETTVKNYFNKFNIEAKLNYTNYSSKPQEDICNFLTKYNINLQSNTRAIISPYELDIYIPDHNLAIEYNGLYWHSEIYKNNNYHKMKYELCKEKGIRLIQIFEDEWLNKSNIIKNKLLHLLHKSNDNKIYARKTKIIEVDKSIKSDFFNQYHIQGDGPSSINYGLEYEGQIVAVIGFIKQKDHYILNRYATSYSVIGGFTKLLSHFEKIYNKPKIITFADLRYSDGDLYYNSGFMMDKLLPPDYYWFNDQIRYHKFNFRHIGMNKKLENYDPELSETQNMHNHGFLKIYDSGKLRFTKN